LFFCYFSFLLLSISIGPAYAIAGLPDFSNNNEDNSSNTSTSTSTSTSEQTQVQSTNGFSTYQNDVFGFTIQYPSDWTVDERDVAPSMLDENTKNPALAIYSTVSFYVNDDSKIQQANFRISPLNVAKYLDTNDLKVKALTA
jgi:hypothetical protein